MTSGTNYSDLNDEKIHTTKHRNKDSDKTLNILGQND